MSVDGSGAALPDAGGERDARELLRSLREGREGLLARGAVEIAGLLGSVGERFLDRDDPLRAAALRRVPGEAGLSPEMAEAVLGGMAADWTTVRLERLLELELGGGAVLDGFVSGGPGRRVRALGAPLTVHVCAGTVPGVSVTSMLRALLVKSAVLLKPGRGDEVLPSLFLRGLEEAAPEVARAAAVRHWAGGGGGDLERVALEGADLVVVYGGDEAVRAVRALARSTTPVVAYPHRVGFAVVGADALSGPSLAETARAAATAVALFDQRGCVSPHLVYVLSPGDPKAFAEALAGELTRLEGELPPGRDDPGISAALHQIRGTAELEAAAGRGRMWSGGGATWTVVMGVDAAFEPSCPGRVVRVKPAASVGAVLEAVRPFRRHLQTVGTAGLEPATLLALAEGLARLGSARLAPLEAAPWPPPWWHHDGGGPLAALVRWTDLEERA